MTASHFGYNVRAGFFIILYTDQNKKEGTNLIQFKLFIELTRNLKMYVHPVETYSFLQMRKKNRLLKTLYSNNVKYKC